MVGGVILQSGGDPSLLKTIFGIVFMIVTFWVLFSMITAPVSEDEEDDKVTRYTIEDLSASGYYSPEELGILNSVYQEILSTGKYHIEMSERTTSDALTFSSIYTEEPISELHADDNSFNVKYRGVNGQMKTVFDEERRMTSMVGENVDGPLNRVSDKVNAAWREYGTEQDQENAIQEQQAA